MKKYDFKKIERTWQKFWAENKVYESDLSKVKKKFYNLMMFPYPSAEGLHVGNMYAFTGSDIYGRFKRMQGYDVFEPIGLDGFGIHSENYALSINTHPMNQAKISEKTFYSQLRMIGNGFAWDEHLETYDPEYYHWTQWIFTEMFKRGLAYRKKAAVNWCPSCKTVLADEQVIQNQCERCDTTIERKKLEQWFFKITKYAERLLGDLEKIDWSERVKIAQRNWIGKSEGALIKFEIKPKTFVEVFTTRPDTLFGATYMVLAPEHELVQRLKSQISNIKEVDAYIKKAKSKTEQERIAETKTKTGVELQGIKAINPANNEEIPIWVADYVLVSYGTGAIMAVPAHDERDYDFAKEFNLPVSDAPLVDKDTVIAKVKGQKEVQYRLRDWLISRQRYWGVPIPLIFCSSCKKSVVNDKLLGKYNKGELKNPGWFAVPENKLPVELPYVEEFRPTGTDKSPLATVESFYKTTCPNCGGEARRETDVSDTFLDSSWYYFRYIDIDNKKEAFSKKRVKTWLPVDMYIGGAEHSVLHLLYTRFITKVFHDWKLIDFDEPFTVFRAHGLLIREGAKMSKSKGNVVNPDEYIKKFGADALRMYLMFLAPLEQGGDFRDTGILGITRFLERVWKLFQKSEIRDQKSGQNKELERKVHKTIKKVTEDIEGLKYNTAISQLMVLLNEMEEHRQNLTPNTYNLFLKLLAPFAPHITEELWHNLGNITSIHKEEWPEFNPKFIKEETFELVVQVNGKVRGTAAVEIGISQKEAQETALALEGVKKNIRNRPVKQTIFVKDKLINFVV